MALLGGLAFTTYGGGLTTYWFEHLPKKAPMSTCPNPKKYDEACRGCGGGAWEFSHACLGGWTEIRDYIRNETHAAVEKDLQQHPEYHIPKFEPGEVAIQIRCSTDTLFGLVEYGPTAFSFYLNAPNDTQKFTIVHEDMETKRQPKCAIIISALENYLKAHYPRANVTLVSSDIFTDFLRLLYAPILMKHQSSSFGLWAGMASRGEVWSVPLRGAYVLQGVPDLGPDWHWSNASTLYGEVWTALNFTAATPIETLVQWLETN